MKKIFYVISMIVALLFLNACSQKKSLEPLRIGLVQWNGYAPVYVSEDLKILPKNIRLIDYTSNYDIVEDFKANRLDAAFLTLDEVIALKQEGVKLKVIYAIDASEGCDVILAKKEIRNIKDLKNKKVVYEPNSVQEYLLFRALKNNNMKKSDIKSILLKYDEQKKTIKRGLF